MYHCAVRRNMGLVHAEQNEQRSPIKFMTSAEALIVSDSESSLDENVRKRARYEDNSGTDDGMDSLSDEENVDADEDMEDDVETNANDELVFPVALKSPFVERITNIKDKITESEIILCDYVFDLGNVEGNKTELASLCIGFEIKSIVLDIWACIRNNKEELRANIDFLRFFCTTNTTLLFPVYNDNHFILVCFDFKRTAIDILDSQAFTNQSDIIFSVPVQSLQIAQLSLLRKRYLNEIVRFEQNTVRSEVMRKSAVNRWKKLELNRKTAQLDGAATLHRR
ncbi:hypothetical protein QQ045_001619 [Rhodiola kirilowii]